jgi:integrase
LLKRTRYQYGSLRLKKRRTGPDAWEFRYYETASDGTRKRRYVTIGTKQQYPSDSLARKAVQALLLNLNAEVPLAELNVSSFGAVIDKFRTEEMPTRYSTRKSYESMIKRHIRPKWADYPLDRIKPMAVEQWLRELKLAPKSKAHVRSVMHLIFTCAERWCLIEMGKNPIALVRVKDSTKRLKRPQILTVEQFSAILSHLKEPYRTMVIVAQCLGLRVSEIVALKWGDFDFVNRTLLVQRSSVQCRVDSVKTEYSRDFVPLDAELATLLLDWKERSLFNRDEDWVFPNPVTGKPYWQEEIQKRHIAVAATAEGLADIGWHTFRHTYRTLLDETGAPMKVQQELMRHASIQTTMNVYGRVLSDTKRQANSKVVQLVLKPAVPAGANEKGAAIAAP